MNQDRTLRRIDMLAQLVYDGQAAALGATNAPKASQFDRDKIRDLVVEQDATFDEIRDVIGWLWWSPRAVWARDRVGNVADFCRLYRRICDGFDSDLTPYKPVSAAVSSAPFAPRVGALNRTPDQIAKSHHEAMRSAGLIDKPIEGEPVKPGDWAEIRSRVLTKNPFRKDPNQS